MASVVIAVFDGLQPAQVTPELMPNLSALASGGVTFANHHAVFPTVTRANASSIVTGMNPGGHGLSANTLLVREFDAAHPIPAMEPQLAEVAAETGRVLLAPTLGQILSEHGLEYVAVGTGTSGNAYLQNPTAESTGGATIHPAFTLPQSLHEDIIARFGDWPDEALPNLPRLAHAERIMTGYILPERAPVVSLIWFSEPDKTQHAAGVGTQESNEAVHGADKQFGVLLDWLERSGRAEDTDVMVVSDHGYSTISTVVNVEAQAREAGFPPGGEPGGVAVAQNGGAVLFYTGEGDYDTGRRLIVWLMEQEWCGTVAVSSHLSGIQGTLPAALIGLEGPRGPDVAMSFRWSSSANQAGYIGRVYSTSGRYGQGQHGSMGRSELRNVLFARGPHFKQGATLNTPYGNTDLAPTILRVLGIDHDRRMDGRVLEEALINGPEEADVEWSRDLHSTERRLTQKMFRQQIKLSRVGETVYVDEGNSTLGWR